MRKFMKFLAYVLAFGAGYIVSHHLLVLSIVMLVTALGILAVLDIKRRREIDHG